MRKTACKSAKTLTDEQVEELKTNAVGILADIRKNVLNRFPFVGSVAMSLDLVPTRDCRISTMATDGQAIYCDIDFLSSLSNDDRIFILAHEVYHNVLMHSLRKESRDAKLFNYATDMEVNNLLKLDGLSVPKTAVLPSSYGFPEGKSAEEYYDLLVNFETNFNNTPQPKSNLGNGSGSDDGSLDGQFDKHIYKDEEVEETGNEDTQDKYGKVGYDPDYRPTVSQSAVEHIREAAVAAAQMIERQCGTLPDWQKKLVNGLLEPKLNWKELLSQFVTKANGNSRTWNRCNRRFVSSGIYLPSDQTEKLKVCIGIDTSGSVLEYTDKFLSEVKGIVSSFDYELTILQCDTEIKDVKSYDSENQLDLDKEKFEMKGFGGTHLHPIFDYIKNNNIECDCCVILTDGYCENFTEADTQDFPVLWCVTKGGDKSTLGFGEICDLED